MIASVQVQDEKVSSKEVVQDDVEIENDGKTDAFAVRILQASLCTCLLLTYIVHVM